MPNTYIAKCYIILGSSNRHFVAGEIIDASNLSEADVNQLLEDGKIDSIEVVAAEPQPAKSRKSKAQAI